VEEGKEMSIDEILKEVAGFNAWLVEITGGEPLIQDGVKVLSESLLKRDYKVLLETNGTESFEELSDDLVKIVDIKCPSSKQEGSFMMDNLGAINPEDEIKFVIGNREDYEFAKRFVEEFICDRTDKILFAPVRPEMEPSTLAEWILKDALRVRLQLQIHKYIWDEERR
jgi:7-carboxy-7-deazaguanine synthase